MRKNTFTCMMMPNCTYLLSWQRTNADFEVKCGKRTRNKYWQVAVQPAQKQEGVTASWRGRCCVVYIRGRTTVNPAPIWCLDGLDFMNYSKRLSKKEASADAAAAAAAQEAEARGLLGITGPRVVG